MKMKKLWVSLCATMLFGAVISSCSDDDDDFSWNDEGSKVELPAATRMFILNEGSMGMNNASISFYNLGEGTPKFVSDIYYDQNGKKLGDTGQDMIAYNGSMYVAVYGSNYLVKLNAAAVVEKTVNFSSVPELQGGIRYLAAEDGFIYASFYGGVVAKFDANTLELKDKLKIDGGFNLEGLAIENDYLYVANSYEKTVDPDTGKNKYVYKKDLFVVDLNNFKLKETVTVTQNPNKVVEEDDKIFVISWDYYDESYVLQMVDPAAGNKVAKLGYATNLAAGNDKLYLVDSRTDYSVKPYVTTNTFSSYDIKSGMLNKASFLKNAPAELATASVYSMAVNDETGDIFINVTHYKESDGEIYRFKADGTYVGKFDCGGQNPRAAVFFNR